MWQSGKRLPQFGSDIELKHEWFVEVGGSAKLFEQIAARESGSNPMVLSSREVGRYLLDWLTRGAKPECGLEMAREEFGEEEFGERDLLEYLLAEGKRAIGLGKSSCATLLLDAAEDLARKHKDYAALTMIGNLFMRAGNDRGRGIQAEAIKLEEKRKEEEERRRREELDRYYDV